MYEWNESQQMPSRMVGVHMCACVCVYFDIRRTNETDHRFIFVRLVFTYFILMCILSIYFF